MVRPILKKCIDCKADMRYSKHHFRCNKCWLKHKERICREVIKKEDLFTRKLNGLEFTRKIKGIIK